VSPAPLDAAGAAHAPARGEVRIVSLVPSITELLCDLGLGAQLVGRTGFCIHPWDTVREIPKVGGTKDVRLQRIRELAPTHVVVNVDLHTRLADGTSLRRAQRCAGPRALTTAHERDLAAPEPRMVARSPPRRPSWVKRRTRVTEARTRGFGRSVHVHFPARVRRRDAWGVRPVRIRARSVAR
jgi:hypothetical protein